MGAVKGILRRGFEHADTVFNAWFGGTGNPLHQLGALGWFFYWIVAASGVYLYIFFDTGVTQAYESVEKITHAQWFAGGVMRSLHRYASDALVVVVVLHLVREFSMDRLRGKRWFAWLTGVPLLWFLYACGISGYWLVWDKLAQYVAVNTSEWLDALPIFGTPVARNFLSSEALSGRFFTLMVFIHIAVPLVMLLLMWVHIQRHANARVNPPRRLAAGTLLTLLAVSLWRPALSQGPANLDRVVAAVDLDWFYLALYPLMDVIPGGWLWLLVAVTTVLFALLPWAPPQSLPPVAKVDLANCNGCSRCFDDCPYSAISMEPRSDGLRYSREAVVNPDQCVSCGICAGACPTATPFRRASDLVAGIQLPELSMASLREQMQERCAGLSGHQRVLAFTCPHGASMNPHAGDDLAVVEVPCVAAVPPSFIDFALSRKLADGVMMAGCGEGNCHHRLGLDWMQQRIEGTRDPRLRARVPRDRLLLSRAGPVAGRQRQRDLESLRERIKWDRSADESQGGSTSGSTDKSRNELPDKGSDKGPIRGAGDTPREVPGQ